MMLGLLPNLEMSVPPKFLITEILGRLLYESGSIIKGFVSLESLDWKFLLMLCRMTSCKLNFADGGDDDSLLCRWRFGGDRSPGLMLDACGKSGLVDSTEAT